VVADSIRSRRRPCRIHSASSAQAMPWMAQPTLAVSRLPKVTARAKAMPARHPASGIHTSRIGVTIMATAATAKVWSGPHTAGLAAEQEMSSAIPEVTNAPTQPSTSTQGHRHPTWAARHRDAGPANGSGRLTRRCPSCSGGAAGSPRFEHPSSACAGILTGYPAWRRPVRPPSWLSDTAGVQLA